MIRALAAGIGFAVSTAPVAADGTHVYAAVFETSDAASASIVRETLTIQNARGREYVVLANADGASAGFAAKLGPDGEIENQPSDAALICYNMATSVVSQLGRNPNGAVSIFISLGGRPVAIPLSRKRDPAHPAEIVASGSLGGAIVDARVETDAGLVSNATFVEYSVAGLPPRVLSSTLCSLARAVPGTPSGAAPAAPVDPSAPVLGS